MGAFCLLVQAYILEWSLILVVLTFINLVADKHLQECITDKKNLHYEHTLLQLDPGVLKRVIVF